MYGSITNIDIIGHATLTRIMASTKENFESNSFYCTTTKGRTRNNIFKTIHIKAVRQTNHPNQ
jgi:hypothetical protein